VQMTTNLPVLAKQIGGALASVLSWKQHADLPYEVKFAITELVAKKPSLNTEKSVDLMADMVGHHGQEFDEDFAKLINKHGVEIVYLAIDYLYESGQRSKTNQDFNDVLLAIDAFKKLSKAGCDIANLELMDLYIHELGGFKEVAYMNQKRIRNFIKKVEQYEDSVFSEYD